MNIQERRIKVKELIDQGYSQRAIAKIIGVTNVTVHRDIKNVTPNVTLQNKCNTQNVTLPITNVTPNVTPNVTLKQEIEDLIKAIPPLLPECKKVGYNSELGFHNKT